MKYYSIPPPAILADYVRHFWVLEGDIKQGDAYIHRCMADGCPDLLFHYKGQSDKLGASDEAQSCFTSGMQGQSHQYKRFIFDDDFGMFGVYFYPHAIPRLFSIPADVVANQMPDLSSLLGQVAAGLEERIMLAKDNNERAAIVSGFLAKQLPNIKDKNPGIADTINFVIQTNGVYDIDKLARRNFLSVRQFERNFKAMCGYSPKLFSRIVRFRATLDMKRHDEQSLTDIAYDCGYYDQSHFIHEFKEFSGYHPMQYFTGKAEGLM